MVKDIFGNEIHAGDYIIYAVKGTKYGDPLRMALITKMKETCHLSYKGEKVLRHSISVRWIRTDWQGKQFTSRSHIDTSRKFIKLSETDAVEFKNRGLVP